MTIKRFSFLLLGIAGLLVLWWKCSSTRYVNFPPTASGPWVAFGDSLTEGYGASEGNNYPALLADRLKITSLTKEGAVILLLTASNGWTRFCNCRRGWFCFVWAAMTA